MTEGFDLIAARLTQVRTELADGERALADLDAQREQLVATLLRLSGAAQVLAEVLAAEPAATAAQDLRGAPAA